MLAALAYQYYYIITQSTPSFVIFLMFSQVSLGEPIHLPHLSCLSLGGATSCVTNLLKKLKLPFSVTLHLCCTSEDPSSYPILCLILAHFHNPAPMEFKSLSVTIDCRKCLVGVAPSASPANSTIYNSWVLEDHRDSKPQLTLSFYQLSRYSLWDFLGQLCSMLAISNLRFLSLSSCDELQGSSWYELFQHCKKITMIQANGYGTYNLLGSHFQRHHRNPLPLTSVTWCIAISLPSKMQKGKLFLNYSSYMCMLQVLFSRLFILTNNLHCAGPLP